MMTCKLKTVFKMQIKQQVGESRSIEEEQIMKKERMEFERDFKKFITPKKYDYKPSLFFIATLYVFM
jgi:hypothetical protein